MSSDHNVVLPAPKAVATIKASNGTSTPVKFNVNFQATVTTDGSIEFTQPVYTAVRRVVYANGDFTTLGDTSKSPNQDPSLNKLLYPKLAGTK